MRKLIMIPWAGRDGPRSVGACGSLLMRLTKMALAKAGWELDRK
jgi:hypothetical protein